MILKFLCPQDSGQVQPMRSTSGQWRAWVGKKPGCFAPFLSAPGSIFSRGHISVVPLPTEHPSLSFCQATPAVDSYLVTQATGPLTQPFLQGSSSHQATLVLVSGNTSPPPKLIHFWVTSPSSGCPFIPLDTSVTNSLN